MHVVHYRNKEKMDRKHNNNRNYDIFCLYHSVMHDRNSSFSKEISLLSNVRKWRVKEGEKTAIEWCKTKQKLVKMCQIRQEMTSRLAFNSIFAKEKIDVSLF